MGQHLKIMIAFFLGIVFTLAIISVKVDFMLTESELHFLIDNKIYVAKS